MPRTLLAMGAHYDDCVYGIPGLLLQAVHRHDRVILSLIGDYTNWPPVAGRERELLDLSTRMARERGMEMRFRGVGPGGARRGDGVEGGPLPAAAMPKRAIAHEAPSSRA